MSDNSGSKFAPKEAFMRWGWDRVMAATDLPHELSEAAFPGWRNAFAAGDPRKARIALGDALAGQDFRWAWLEQCFDWIHRVIEPVHGWPHAWRTPRRKLLKLPGSRMDLLALELGGMVYQARNRTDFARLRQHEPRSNMVYEVVLVSGWGCPAEDAIARLFAARFAAGDGSSWPPYFPGDRTTIRFDVFSRHESVGEIARCALRGVEPVWPLSITAPWPVFPAIDSEFIRQMSA